MNQHVYTNMNIHERNNKTNLNIESKLYYIIDAPSSLLTLNVRTMQISFEK
jgi:hypothetical protein